MPSLTLPNPLLRPHAPLSSSWADGFVGAPALHWGIELHVGWWQVQTRCWPQGPCLPLLAQSMGLSLLRPHLGRETSLLLGLQFRLGVPHTHTPADPRGFGVSLCLPPFHFFFLPSLFTIHFTLLEFFCFWQLNLVRHKSEKYICKCILIYKLYVHHVTICEEISCMYVCTRTDVFPHLRPCTVTSIPSSMPRAHRVVPTPHSGPPTAEYPLGGLGA